MHMLEDQQAMYGDLCFYLRNRFPELVKDRKEWKTKLSIYGDLDVGLLMEWDTSNGTRLDHAIKWGSDPLVAVTALSKSFGLYHVGSNTVHLDKHMVNAYEQYEAEQRTGREISDSDVLYGSANGHYSALLIEIVIMSLLVTWGDYQDGAYGGIKRLKKFQKAMFGKVRKRSRLLVEIR